jgi:electron transport complex protein RnfA
MISLMGLAVFSGFSLNLLLQFALGTAGSAGNIGSKTESRRKLPVIQHALLFFSALFLWIFFTYLMPNYWKGFSEFFLLFPLSALTCMGLELLGERIYKRVFPSGNKIQKAFSAFTAYEGLVPASLILTFLVAKNFKSALVLTLFFAIGNLTAMLILNEIRRRSSLEWVPQYLRGSPLILISMGLLSLVSASVAGICFRILETF